MAGAALERVLKRDRAVVVTAVLVLTALAWAYVLWTAALMSAGRIGLVHARHEYAWDEHDAGGLGASADLRSP